MDRQTRERTRSRVRKALASVVRMLLTYEFEFSGILEKVESSTDLLSANTRYAHIEADEEIPEEIYDDCGESFGAFEFRFESVGSDVVIPGCRETE